MIGRDLEMLFWRKNSICYLFGTVEIFIMKAEDFYDQRLRYSW